MIGLSDIPKFFLAFFLVLPVISLLHEAGHVFFAWLMGGRNIRISIGTGKKLFGVGMLEVRKYYFWYGLCTFENLKRNKRFGNILIFFGGSLFNALAAFAVILLIENRILEATVITYQFTYFTLYYVFFALLPMSYPDGNYSDGKIIYDLLINNKEIINEKTYRMHWDEKKEHWNILDHKRKVVEIHDHKKQALLRAQEIARANRPSRVMESKSKREREVHNYPRIPL